MWCLPNFPRALKKKRNSLTQNKIIENLGKQSHIGSLTCPGWRPRIDLGLRLTARQSATSFVGRVNSKLVVFLNPSHCDNALLNISYRHSTSWNNDTQCYFCKATQSQPAPHASRSSNSFQILFMSFSMKPRSMHMDLASLPVPSTDMGSQQQIRILHSLSRKSGGDWGWAYI